MTGAQKEGPMGIRLSPSTIRLLAEHGDGEARSAMAGYRFAGNRHGSPFDDVNVYRTFRAVVATPGAPCGHVCIAYQGHVVGEP